MTAIPQAEVRFHEMSFCDHSGRLFWWGEELYRALSPRKEQLFRKMFDDGTIDRLVSNSLLVETKRTDLQLNGYGLVLHHRRIPFVSYPFEWCFEMLRDAAFCIIDLEIELAQDGLTNVDCNPWNVIFDGTRPLFVDVASIMPDTTVANSLWMAHAEFLTSFMYPLELMAAGCDRVARALMHDREKGVGIAEYEAILGKSKGVRQATQFARRVLNGVERRLPGALHGRVLRSFSNDSAAGGSHPTAAERVRFLQKVRRDVASIPAPRLSDSDQHSIPSNELAAVTRVVADLKPASILHFDHLDFKFAQASAEFARNTISCSSDPARASQAYSAAKTLSSKLMPLVLDFRFPSPASGIANEIQPATRRLRSELVLATHAITDLVFNRSLRLEQISQGIADFCSGSALVKFQPIEKSLPESQQNSEGWKSHYSFYSFDGIVRALEQHFVDIQKVDDIQGDVLLLCRRRS